LGAHPHLHAQALKILDIFNQEQPRQNKKVNSVVALSPRKPRSRNGSRNSLDGSNGFLKDPHDKYKPVRILKAGIIKKKSIPTRLEYPGIENYPIRKHQDFKILYDMKHNLDPRITNQFLKLFKLYRQSVISSHDFLEMIKPFLMKSQPDLIGPFRELILSREKTRRNHNINFKPLQKMKFEGKPLILNI